MVAMVYNARRFTKSIYARITLTRVTTFFFIFSLVHCFAQGIIQSFLFSIDQDHRDFLSSIVTRAVHPPNTTYLEGSNGHLHLQICNDIPHGQPQNPCTTVFNSSVDSPKAGSDSQAASTITRFVDWDDFFEVFPAQNLDDPGSLGGVVLQSLQTGKTTQLSLQCVQNLVHPEQILTNSRREELAFVGLHFWLFAISVIAIVNDSVPHILSVMITRATVTVWSIYAVWRTRRDQSVFQELLADPGTPCSLELFSSYFQKRLAFQIADLVLACTAFLIFLYLSSVLLKLFDSQAFKCVGAPKHINRINKFFMALLACLQLEVFVLTTAMSMWVDVLLNTAIAKISAHTGTYKGVFISTTLILIPWIIMGWFAIKREIKILMALFLFIAFVIILGWSIMFYSIVYRWTFVQWPFLGCFTVASLLLLTASFVLGGICLHHFGQGHAEYLRAEAALASLNFTREVFTRNEERDKFDLTTTADKARLSDVGKGPHQIYYIQTLESDIAVDGLNTVAKGPFSRV